MKRRLFMLVSCLFLGAIINVGVAWGCAAWLTIDPNQSKLVQKAMGEESIDERYMWWLWQLKRPGARRLISSQFHFSTYYEERSKLTATAISKRFSSWNIAPSELRPSYRQSVTIVDGRGWPLQTLFWIATSDEDAGPRLPGAGVVEVGFRQGLIAWIYADFEPRYSLRLQRTPAIVEDWYLGNPALPLRPIWPGFAINTVFYAAIVWVLWSSPFTARRMIRRKRGLCINCGYDLRGAEHEVCPECGARTC